MPAIKGNQRRQRKDQRQQTIRESKYNRESFKRIKGHVIPTLTALQKEDGSYVTHPNDMDRLLQEQWQKVYDGNSDDLGHTIKSYLSKYIQFLFRSRAHIVPDITGQDLYEVIQASQHTASGLD